MPESTIHSVARCGLAFVFAYHGLVPKLLSRNADEIAMLRDAGLSTERSTSGVLIFGVAELAFALLLLVFWRQRWPLFICIAAMCLALIGVTMNSPRFLNAAFNPVSLNATVVCLAVVDLLALRSRDNDTEQRC
jgi:hypothetical protein